MKSPWICAILAAEAAADFRRDHAQTVLGDAGHQRHDEADDVRILRRVPERHLAGGRHVVRDGAAWFHRGRDQALLDDAIADDDLGGLERRIDVSAGHGPMEGDVVRRLGMQLRRAVLGRQLRIDHSRQRFVVDVDQVERIVSLLCRLGDDDRDRIADVADDVAAPSRDKARS